eukprot:8715067-Pyramimonas_sp.AAC.1
MSSVSKAPPTFADSSPASSAICPSRPFFLPAGFPMLAPLPWPCAPAVEGRGPWRRRLRAS